jgi:hypothetical protein
MVRIGQNTFRRILWAAAAAAVAGMAVCLYSLIFMMPGEDVAALEAASQGPRPEPGVRQAPVEVAPLSAYAAVWHRNLRQPLGDGPAASPAAKAVLSVPLIGTAVDPGHSTGMFRDAAGKVRWVGVGEMIGGAKVMAIQEGSATVEFGGEKVTLSVTKGQALP